MEPRSTDGVDPRVYLAEERTLLAWLRTGVSLMGFGFVVARFGLFLRMVSLGGHAEENPLAVALGLALVLVGVAVNLLAVHRHRARVAGLRAGRFDLPRHERAGVGIAAVLALIGVGLVVHLLVGPTGLFGDARLPRPPAAR